MKIVATTLVVLLACVAIATIQACAEEVVANNVATSKEAKSERLGQKAAMMELQRSSQIHRNMATGARQAAAAKRVKTMPRPRPMTTAQKERVEEVKAKLQAAAENRRIKYKSMQEARKEMNDRIMHRVHAEEKMGPGLEQLHNQRNSEAKSAAIGHANYEVNPVRVDTEAIVKHAKMAVERAENMPSSFQQWEERMKEKMTHQRTAAKMNDKVISSAVHRYVNPEIRNNLAKEIEAEGKKIPRAPYSMPLRERGQQAINQASHNYPQPGPNYKTYPDVPERKVWENMVQARLEAMKENPQVWEEMKNRVEMSAPDQPFSPRRHPHLG